MSASSEPTWVVIPVLNNLEMSLDAIGDALNQSVPTRVLIVNQGSDDDTRRALERESEQRADRLYVWSHVPPLLSLSATWNRALMFCWETGADRALVINNDLHIHRHTAEVLNLALDKLDALFVSAVAVTQEQFDAAPSMTSEEWLAQWDGSKGGPDFSCFLISKRCHDQFPFDQGYIPAYGEDVCYHRELMLAGLGGKIFSINLPYWHYASGTLKTLPPDKRVAFERRVAQSRRYHEQIWGGPINAERFARKSDPSSVAEGVSTPELQRLVQACDVADDALHKATSGSTEPNS